VVVNFVDAGEMVNHQSICADIKTNNKKPTIPKMNDNINMDSTVAVSECS
jgi:hypothetical protein